MMRSNTMRPRPGAMNVTLKQADETLAKSGRMPSSSRGAAIGFAIEARPIRLLCAMVVLATNKYRLGGRGGSEREDFRPGRSPSSNPSARNVSGHRN